MWLYLTMINHAASYHGTHLEKPILQTCKGSITDDERSEYR